MVDQLEAVKQAVFKILQTERFRYLIYSFNYGVEMHGLIGQSPGLVQAELRRRIREALEQDDRIQSVEHITLTNVADQLLITFSVVTDYGTFQVEQEVDSLV
jgi:pyruvate/oxaloacetate carboxyltransferase